MLLEFPLLVSFGTWRRWSVFKVYCQIYSWKQTHWWFASSTTQRLRSQGSKHNRSNKK